MEKTRKSHGMLYVTIFPRIKRSFDESLFPADDCCCC